MHHSSSTLIIEKEQSNKHQITIHLNYFSVCGMQKEDFFFFNQFQYILSPAVFLLPSKQKNLPVL